MPTKLTNEIITAAIEGFEAQKARIDGQIGELKAMLSGGPAKTATTSEAAPRKHKMSAGARRRMALGQKRRWQKIRGETEPSAPATPEPAKPKRRISEEGMKRIIAATKKRWRLAKAAATAKKAAPARKKAPAKAGKKRATKKTATAAAPTSVQTAG